MSAKTNLIERLKYLDAAIKLPQLIDVGIAPSDHNGIANLLRKGLGIVAFNILEDFIKDKATESLDTISRSSISFNNLTDQLQESATSGVLGALQFQSRLFKNDNSGYRLLIQNEAGNINSTKGLPYTLSPLSLVSSQSNIAGADIGNILKSFGISGGWATLKTISDNIGGGLPDLASAFNNAATRRHSAAHTASFQFEHAFLSNLKAEILAICASLDILLSARCRQVIALPSVKIDSHNLTEHSNYRFLEARGTVYRETRVIGGPSRRNWASLTAAVADLQPRLLSRKEFLIELNVSRRIENWYV